MEAPEYDPVRKNWKYKIKTKDIEGDELHIVIAAYPKSTSIKVITRW
jgi:hypothetical protein